MHGAAIVPDDEVAGLFPRYGSYESRLGRELDRWCPQMVLVWVAVVFITVPLETMTRSDA